jgi:hypothetical protein
VLRRSDRQRAEKLLVVRCYRNTLQTAAKSVDHALWVRDYLIKSRATDSRVSEQVDIDLVTVGGNQQNAWPARTDFAICSESSSWGREAEGHRSL